MSLAFGIGIGLGAMRLSTTDVEESVAERLVCEAFDRGVRFFDTADVYAPSATQVGHNERLLARALGPHRLNVVIATKGGLRRSGKKWIPDGRAKHLTDACEASLRALDTECIDLYQLHAPDPKVQLETSLRALAKLLRDGKVRRVGLCNVRLEELERSLEVLPASAVQVELNALVPRPLKNGVALECARRGIPLIAHSPLGGHRRAQRLGKLTALARIARRHGVSPFEIALAWLLRIDPCVVPIPGATRRDTLLSCLHASDVQLDETDVRELDEAIPSGRVLRSPRAFSSDTSNGEVVMMMGYPGAGKSTVAEAWIERGYRRLSRDEAGGSLQDLLPELDRLLGGGERRIVLDNTYPRRESRFDVIEVAASHDVPVRCVVLETSLEQSQVNAVRRMLSRYGRLLDADDLARAEGADANTFLPEAQFRFRREREAVRPEEGFHVIDRRPFQGPTSAVGVNRALFFDALDDTPERGPALARAVSRGYRLLQVTYAPDRTSPQGETTEEGLECYFCPHPPGPPACWCRKPLPGLGLLLIQRYALDPSACRVVGDTSADRGFAERLGIQIVSTPVFFGGDWIG